MLEYEGWGNPSQMILTNSDQVPVDHHNGIDIFNSSTTDSHNNHTYGSGSALYLDYHTNTFFNNNDAFTPQHHFLNNTSSQLHHHPVYDTRPFSSYNPFDNIPSNNSAPPAPSNGSYFVIPKVEEGSIANRRVGGTRIGMNLGHRTYFYALDDDFVNRFYRRSRPGGGGVDGVGGGMVNSPRCQAEGCAADLSSAKHYHRRHKVCDFHSKAATVMAGGLTQRFCQQCSRFHLLTEFDNGKRSCRKRLADHNRRRRKTPQLPTSSSSQGQLELQKSPVETSFNNLGPSS